MRDVRTEGEVKNLNINPYAESANKALKSRDGSRYMKVSVDAINFMFDLSGSEMRVMLLVMHELIMSGYNKDIIQLTNAVKDAYCADLDVKMSNKTFERGRAGLIRASVLHKATRNGWYWVSPDIVFCGNIRHLMDKYDKIEKEDVE